MRRLPLLAAILLLGTASPAFAAKLQLQPNHLPHGLGLVQDQNAGVHQDLRNIDKASGPRTAGNPASVDLSQYAMPIGDQGQVNSCASWATIYGALGIWENRDPVTTPGPGSAPMYAYSQVNGGQDNGSTIDAPLNIAKTQGVDSRGDYFQGDFDWRDQPTASERANAVNWQLTGGYTDLTYYSQIEDSLANGHPVVIGMPVTSSFEYNTSGVYPDNNGYDDYYTLGNHAIVAVGYDANGLLIRNSWGTSWGAGGTVRIAWQWVYNNVFQATDVGDIKHATPPPPPPPPPPPVVKPPARPTFTKTPKHTTRAHTNAFAYRDATKGVKFQIRIDGSRWITTTSTRARVFTAKHRRHCFDVRATKGGKASQTRSYVYTVKR